MKKLALSLAVSTILATPAFAAPYEGTATSGTAANSLASIVVVAGAPTSVWYVDPLSGTASNKTAPAIQLVKDSVWTFDFTNLAAVTFTGNIQMNDYKTQTFVQVTPTSQIDGRQTYTGVTINMTGTGAYDESTNTFTYNFFNTVVNGAGASTTTEGAPATCVNGGTSALGKVCSSFATASKGWEGLALNFVFTEDRGAFAGTLTATDTSGASLSRNTTTVNWQIVADVPVPAAAWLFGSGLVGLAGAARRRSKK
jgi:hypothetical protein